SHRLGAEELQAQRHEGRDPARDPSPSSLRQAERSATDQVQGGTTPARKGRTHSSGLTQPSSSLTRPDHREAGRCMPKKPNYNFEKRQKELARKQKKEEKRARKRDDQQLSHETPESAPEQPAEPQPK